MADINQNFSMFAGNTKEIDISVDNSISLNGATFVFSVYQDQITYIQKTDITVSGNTLAVTLNPSDTQDFTGEYDYDCVLTDQLGNVTTLITGTIRFNQGGGGLTAEQVFITAMSIMDEDSQDGTFAGYPNDYKKKAWPILTLLQAELTPASVTPTTITDENSTLYLDDRTCLMVLPYGLAAQLLLTQDQYRASFFNARYDELKRKRPAKIVPIKDVYNTSKINLSANSDSVTYVDGGSFFDINSTDLIDGGEF